MESRSTVTVAARQLKTKHLQKPQTLIYALSVFMTLAAKINTLLVFPPAIVLFVWLMKYNVDFIQRFRQRRWLMTGLVILLSVGMVTSMLQPIGAQSAPGGFSFLFQNSEASLKNCVLSGVAGLAFIAAIVFGGLRVAFMVGLGVAGYNIVRQRQQQQDFQDTVNLVLVALLVVGILGVIEPFIIGPGTC